MNTEWENSPSPLLTALTQATRNYRLAQEKQRETQDAAQVGMLTDNWIIGDTL